MQSVLTCTKAVEHVVAGCVARVDGSALIPISAVGVNRIDHGRLLCSNPRTPACIVYQLKDHDLHCTELTARLALASATNGSEVHRDQLRPPQLVLLGRSLRLATFPLERRVG